MPHLKEICSEVLESWIFSSGVNMTAKGDKVRAKQDISLRWRTGRSVLPAAFYWFERDEAPIGETNYRGEIFRHMPVLCFGCNLFRTLPLLVWVFLPMDPWWRNTCANRRVGRRRWTGIYFSTSDSGTRRTTTTLSSVTPHPLQLGTGARASRRARPLPHLVLHVPATTLASTRRRCSLIGQ